MVLLPPKEGQNAQSSAAYLAPLRQAVIDKNSGHVNVVVCERDYSEKRHIRAKVSRIENSQRENETKKIRIPGVFKNIMISVSPSAPAPWLPILAILTRGSIRKLDPWGHANCIPAYALLAAVDSASRHTTMNAWSRSPCARLPERRLGVSHRSSRLQRPVANA
jgi:hypothetical protein